MDSVLLSKKADTSFSRRLQFGLMSDVQIAELVHLDVDAVVEMHS